MALIGMEVVLRQLRTAFVAKNLEHLSDADLVRRLAERGDESAFAVVLRRHGDLVLNVCRNVLRHNADADDAFQAAFLVLARKAASIRQQTSLAGWLHGVAFRCAMDVKKSNNRRRQLEKAAASRTTESPASLANLRELQAILDEEIHRLAEPYRAAFVVCCLEGKSRSEAAQALGWKEGTLASRLAKARAILQKRLSTRGVTLSATLGATAISSTGLSASASAAMAQRTIDAALAFAAGNATAKVSSQALMVAQGTLKGMLVTKLKIGAILILGTSLTIAAAQGLVAQPQAVDKPANKIAAPPPPAVKGQWEAKIVPVVRKDFFGDPLPGDALMRLGTLRFREPSFNFSPRPGLRQQLLPDGRTRLVGNAENIRWLEASTGRLIRSWPLPTGFEMGGFSQDGQLLLLTDRKTLQLWDLTKRKEVRHFQVKGSVDAYLFTHFTSDGRFVATRHLRGDGFRPQSAGMLRVFDVETGKELWQEGSLDQLGQGPWAVGFLPDNETLVVSDSMDNRISLRDRATGEKRRSFETAPDLKQHEWQLAPDGKTVFLKSQTVRAWDLPSGKEMPALNGPGDNNTYFVAVSPDSKTVLTVAEDRFVLIWDWPAGKLRGKIDLGKRRSRRDFQFSADGRRAEIVSFPGFATRHFDLQTGQEFPGPAQAHRGEIVGLAIAPDGKIVTAANDLTIRVWDPDSGRQLHEHNTDLEPGWTTMALSPDGRVIATGDEGDRRVLLHERETGRLLQTIVTGDQRVQKVSAIGFSPNGALLAILCEEFRNSQYSYYLLLWDLKLGRETQRLMSGTYRPVFSPDSHHLVSANDNGTQLVEVATGHQFRNFKDSGRVAFSPDGRMMAIDGANGLILWELSSASERRRIAPAVTGFRGITFRAGLQFSLDGRSLGRINQRTIELYDVLRGERLHSFDGHDFNVYQIAFAPDGRRLVSGSGDSTALIWDVAGVLARQPKAKTPDTKTLGESWNDLATTDAADAFRALGRLVDGGDWSVALMRDRLHPAGLPDAERFDRLLQGLGSDRFADRERATEELEGLEEMAEPALRRFLTQDQPLEARRRAGALLARIHAPITRPERLQRLRALEALEYIGSNAARQVLKAISKGASDFELTREAKAASERLATRPPIR